MLNDLEAMMQKVTGPNADPQAVADAARQHVDAQDADQVSGHLQDAADNARQSGDEEMAQQLEAIIERKQVDPSAFKAAAVDFIKEHPDVLQRFEPEFARGILGKLL